MRRAFGLALLLAVVAAAPAGAVNAGPTVLDFENQAPGTATDDVYPNADVAFIDGDTGCGSVSGAGGNFGPRHLADTCRLTLVFRDGQAVVGLYGRTFEPSTPGAAAVAPSLTVTAFDANQALVEQKTVPDGGSWSPVVVKAPPGAATIARVVVESPQSRVSVDDIGYSPLPQPDTEITAGPTGTTGSRDASFTFTGNQDLLTFTCRLDGGPEEPCTSPKAYSGLGDGQHSFSVAATDRWGSKEDPVTTHTWTVTADRDLDGVLDGTDNCPDNANSGQGDADGDRIGDACEILPTRPPEAGKEMAARVLSGEVFVKLPPGVAASAFTAALRVPFQDSGFLPLKGVAAVPVGSVIDARRGRLALTAAINGRPARDRRQLRREAQFAAGIFAIRQKRASRRRPSRRIPPRAVLTSAPGAERPCARRTAAGGPPKGVRVRSLTTIAKGAFRTVGGASTATPVKGNPTFITTDRCDGTVTEVGRGRVAVAANRTGRSRTVRAGRAYFVKARLFAARKGRRGG